MQAFDFDNTIYKGESAFDFALFAFKKNKRFILYTFPLIRLLIKYKRCKMTPDEFTDELNKYIYIIVGNKAPIEDLVVEFWSIYDKNLYLNMLEKIHFNDVIVTTCPNFIMKGIQKRLRTKNILCTDVDLKRGKINYLNFGDNKVRLFKKKYPNRIIKNFYTDSYNDKPFMEFSKNVYLVNHGDCTKIK